MTALVLSIIVILGLAGGPTDFGDTCSTEEPAAVSVNQ